MADNKFPLDGVRVLDFTQVMMGPSATQMLGDWGADVIKVERPKYGDLARAYFGSRTEPVPFNPVFCSLNRNKRSITLNTKNKGGIEAVYKLVEQMDVVINNFRPGVMDRMGLGYEKLKDINPRIIFASGSGFGDSGPNVSKGGQDVLAQAMTGVMTRKPDNSNPTAIFGTTLCDYTAGMHLVQGILAALLMREKTGEGQMIKVSLYDSMLAMQMQEAAMILEENYELNWSAMPLTGAFETSDGALVLVGAFKPNPLQDICRVLGLEDLSKIYSDFDSQRANKKLIQDSFRKAFLKNTTEYWLERLEEEDLLCAPIRNLREALDDPQTKHNEMVTDVPLNNNLTARLIGSPVKLSAVQFKVRHSPPDLGQDTHNILQEYGFDDSQIKAMKDQGDLG